MCVEPPDTAKSRSKPGRFRYAWLAVWLLIAGFFGLSALMPEGPAPLPAVTPAGVVKALPTKPIENVVLGERVAGRNPLPEEVEPVRSEPDEATWRSVTLVMPEENGGSLRIELLCPRAWFEAHDVAPGGTVYLALAELGAEGDALVLDVGPCPPIQPGCGQVVSLAVSSIRLRPPSTSV